ncbi:large ribosomal subunit protein uL1m [Monosporozyma servazzii]
MLRNSTLLRTVIKQSSGKLLAFPIVSKSLLSTTALRSAQLEENLEESIAPVSKLTKDQLKRRELKRKVKHKIQARLPAHVDPLYVSVPNALRIIRALEVGQPESQQTITVTMQVINEKGVNPLNGDIQLPHPLKASKIVAFSNDPTTLEKVAPLCMAVGGQDLIDKIIKGELPITEIDSSFATPDIAPKLSQQLGKLLGRRGILPNAKKGTVAEDLLQLIQSNVGKIPFRQRGGEIASVNISVGKCTMSDHEILENIIAARTAVMEAVKTQKNKAAKKHQVSILGRTTLTSTHGPGLVIDFV